MHQVQGWVSMGNCIKYLLACSYNNMQTIGLEGKSSVREIKETYWRASSFPHTLGTLRPKKGLCQIFSGEVHSINGLALFILACNQWRKMGCKSEWCCKHNIQARQSPELVPIKRNILLKNCPLNKMACLTKTHGKIKSKPHLADGKASSLNTMTRQVILKYRSSFTLLHGKH